MTVHRPMTPPLVDAALRWLLDRLFVLSGERQDDSHLSI